MDLQQSKLTLSSLCHRENAGGMLSRQRMWIAYSTLEVLCNAIHTLQKIWINCGSLDLLNGGVLVEDLTVEGTCANSEVTIKPLLLLYKPDNT